MKSNILFRQSLKRLSSKIKSEKNIKIDNFYEFMDENIKTNREYDNKIVDDERILLSLVRCPMTNSNLENNSEGLKVAVIID